MPSGGRPGAGREVIPVMLVGDVGLARTALAAVLTHTGDLRVVSSLSLGADLVAAARDRQPAVAVLDLSPDRHPPGAHTLDAVERLCGQAPRCRALLLVGRYTEAVLKRALSAGVWGVLSQEISPEQLVVSIRQVAAGERVVEHRLAAAALRVDDSPLTDQERVVLGLAATGARSRDIGDQLFLSAGTVRNYLSSAIRKTGARNRLEAVRWAREAGWL